MASPSKAETIPKKMWKIGVLISSITKKYVPLLQHIAWNVWAWVLPDHTEHGRNPSQIICMSLSLQLTKINKIPSTLVINNNKKKKNPLHRFDLRDQYSYYK
jgi:hypothetical protein